MPVRKMWVKEPRHSKQVPAKTHYEQLHRRTPPSETAGAASTLTGERIIYTVKV